MTFREGGEGPLTFTVFLTRAWRLEFAYLAVRVFGRWFNYHTMWRNIPGYLAAVDPHAIAAALPR